MIGEGTGPCRRELGLIVESIGEELLVFDQERSRAHSLNSTAARVWRSCDGHRDLDAVATDCGLDRRAVELAVERLSAAHLLQEDSLPSPGEQDPRLTLIQPTAPGVSRRAMLRRSLAAGAGLGVAIPVIRSITAPTIAMAATNGRVKGKAGQACTSDNGCSPRPFSFCNTSTGSCQRSFGASCAHTSSCAHSGGSGGYARVCAGTCTDCLGHASLCPTSHPNCSSVGLCR